MSWKCIIWLKSWRTFLGECGVYSSLSLSFLFSIVTIPKHVIIKALFPSLSANGLTTCSTKEIVYEPLDILLP